MYSLKDANPVDWGAGAERGEWRETARETMGVEGDGTGKEA